MAINKDVVTLEISVYNERIVAVEINQPMEDLPGPVLDGPNVHLPIPLPVPGCHPNTPFHPFWLLLNEFDKYGSFKSRIL